METADCTYCYFIINDNFVKVFHFSLATMYDVTGKRAIVTGGAQGFGKQFARRLLQLKCRVVITDIDEKKGQDTKKEFQDQFGLKDTR